jgi:hypothetical protein
MVLYRVHAIACEPAAGCRGVQGAGFELGRLAKSQFRDFSTELNLFLFSPNRDFELSII